MSDSPPNLLQIESDIWQRLTSAANGASDGWRTPIIATSSDAGPKARTIVLRTVNTRTRQLLFHTDARSPKVAQLKADERVSVVFYDAQSMTQLVIEGHASLHSTDELADTEWTATSASSRRAYLAPLPPGQRTDEPEPNLPANVAGRVPTEPELEPGRPNFIVISIGVQRIDWLQLDRSGNLRAEFEYADEDVSASWLAC